MLQVLSDRYRIEREIGSGGMATVYLAEDLRHRREVALKVLHPDLAAAIGTERFLAEITTTATLQHPGILPLFDSGVADGLVYYVMPYVRGESLRARLDREGPLPIDEAIRIAAAVADALDYAHGQGIIHRDIKPENILLSAPAAHSGEGRGAHAFVADFGVALAVTRAGGERLTQTGLAVGTVPYMSPEQAMAERSLDARSDVFSLGTVCYEMLAGELPFAAPTAQAVVSRLLADDPRPVSALRKSVSPSLEAAVHKALEKNPADRWRSAREFAHALTQAEVQPSVAARSGETAVARPRRNMAGVAGALVLGALLGAGALAAWSPRAAASDDAAATPRRWAIALPDSSPFAPTVDEYAAPGAGIAISPDGRLVAYVGRNGTATGLQLARLDDGTVTPLAGTEGARLPAFSPDGRWLAFIARGELRKLAVDGGAIVRLGPVEAPTGLLWMTDERLLVSRNAIGPGTIAASGGRFEPLGALAQAPSFIHAQLLPDGTRFLGTTAYGELGVISQETGAVRFLTSVGGSDPARAEFGNALRGRNPRYLASGHLLYSSGSSLMAVPFDVKTLRATGKPTPVASDLRAEGGPGEAHYAVSDEGTLVYASGVDGSNGSLVWVDDRGAVTDTLLPGVGALLAMRLSRDGRALALSARLENGAAETRVVDLTRRVEDRARLNGEFAVASWTGDGRGLLGSYVPDTVEGRACCFVGAELDAATLSLRVPPAPAGYDVMIAFDESRDGTLRCEDAVRRPAAGGAAADGEQVLLLRAVAGGAPPREVAAGVQGDCAFSPDGRWIAFTNRNGLFVTRATPDTSARATKIAPGATSQVRWMPNGSALVYRVGRTLERVTVRTAGDAIEASEPRVLFQHDGLFTTWDVWGMGWDVGPDGRLLVWRAPAPSAAPVLRAITQLPAFVAQRVGTPASRR